MKNAVKRGLFHLRFKMSAANNPIFMGYYRSFWKPRKGTIEELLDQFSRATKDFTVVQIGANDGITHDPIHKFIKRDKWTGVLLEPQKEVYEKYLSKIYRKHSNITTLNAALGHEDGHMPIYKIGFSNARWATGLTTFDKPTLEKAFTSGHVKRKCEKEGIAIPEDASQHIVEEKVDVLSAEQLLKSNQIEKIDLLMIDTEGFDYEVIKMMNIEESSPSLIIFEHSHLSDKDYQDCESYLSKNKYKTKKDGANTVAMKTDLAKNYSFFAGS